MEVVAAAHTKNEKHDDVCRLAQAMTANSVDPHDNCLHTRLAISIWSGLVHLMVAEPASSRAGISDRVYTGDIAPLNTQQAKTRLSQLVLSSNMPR